MVTSDASLPIYRVRPLCSVYRSSGVLLNQVSLWLCAMSGISDHVWRLLPGIQGTHKPALVTAVGMWPRLHSTLENSLRGAEDPLRVHLLQQDSSFRMAIAQT